jgi:hypothetical protein
MCTTLALQSMAVNTDRTPLDVQDAAPAYPAAPVRRAKAPTGATSPRFVVAATGECVRAGSTFGSKGAA